MTHAELVKIAEEWLTKKCGVVLVELVTAAYETPDAIGFRSHESILVECKASRPDFLSDRDKIFRKNPHMGMGKYRYFLCEKGLINPNELPDKWGLLYVNDKRQVRQKVGPKGNIWSINKNFIFEERNIQNEMALMYSALRRLSLRGVLGLIYDKPWENEDLL